MATAPWQNFELIVVDDGSTNGTKEYVQEIAFHQPGINKGVVDNFVGTHYLYCTGGPGEIRVYAQFRVMGLMGNPYRSDITITLYDEAELYCQYRRTRASVASIYGWARLSGW